MWLLAARDLRKMGGRTSLCKHDDLVSGLERGIKVI